jgi:periplasmic copper chaperone A
MRLLLAIWLLCSFQTISATESALLVSDSQIRQPMPGRTVTAGYFTLYNQTAQDASLTGVSSSAFERVELHQHSHKDGMMRMEKLDQITIAAGEKVSLAPGGLHLMLFEPAAELEIGQTVAVLLHFADGQQLTVAMPVVAMPKR